MAPGVGVVSIRVFYSKDAVKEDVLKKVVVGCLYDINLMYCARSGVYAVR